MPAFGLIPATTLAATWSQGTFAARPAASMTEIGRRYYATDTGIEYLDIGTAWVIVKVDVPDGAVTAAKLGSTAKAAHASVSSSSTASVTASYVDVSGLSVTVTPTVPVYYLAFPTVGVYVPGAAALPFNVKMLMNAGQVGPVSSGSAGGNASYDHAHVIAGGSAAAGSHTFKGQVQSFGDPDPTLQSPHELHVVTFPQ